MIAEVLIGMIALGAAMKSDAQYEVEEIEQAIGRAVVAHDVPFMDQLWAEDFIYTGIRAEVKGKPEVLTEFNAGQLRFTKMEFDDVRVRIYGETAVATGRATTVGQSPQGEISGQSRYTRLYVRREGRWQLVAFQATPLTASSATK